MLLPSLAKNVDPSSHHSQWIPGIDLLALPPLIDHDLDHLTRQCAHVARVPYHIIVVLVWQATGAATPGLAAPGVPISGM